MSDADDKVPNPDETPEPTPAPEAAPTPAPATPVNSEPVAAPAPAPVTQPVEAGPEEVDLEKAVKHTRSIFRSVWFWVIAGPVNLIIAALVIAFAFPFIFLGFPEPPAGLESVKKAVVIDKFRQAAYGYENGKLVSRYVVLTGDGDHDTPVGKFKITKKDKDYVSRQYGDPMPNAVFFIESRGIAMHSSFAVGFKWCAKLLSGHHPYIGSHGCVRMTPWGSHRMYKFGDFGTPVWVIDTRN
ncbi:MAG: L,D-transpeptidase [Verrucomicrobiales bacterium]|nr:L,D-transpeptidase [Verrucomicrobiales bacterium]